VLTSLLSFVIPDYLIDKKKVGTKFPISGISCHPFSYLLDNQYFSWRGHAVFDIVRVGCCWHGIPASCDYIRLDYWLDDSDVTCSCEVLQEIMQASAENWYCLPRHWSHVLLMLWENEYCEHG